MIKISQTAANTNKLRDRRHSIEFQYPTYKSLNSFATLTNIYLSKLKT